jgi:signal transduction histidine kinase
MLPVFIIAYCVYFLPDSDIKPVLSYLIIFLPVFVLSMASLFVSSVQSTIGKVLRAQREFKLGDLDYTIPMEKADNDSRQLYRSFNNMGALVKEYTEQAIAVQNDLALAQQARMIAHDIRSPVSALDVILKKKCIEDQAFEDLMGSAIKRIKEITDDILSPNSKYHQRHQQSNSYGGDELQQIIDNLLSEKRLETSQKKGIVLNSEYENLPKNIRVRAAAPELRRVLSNLLNNSIEAVGETGKIKVGLSLDGKKVLLTVTDNGCGIPSSTLSKLGHKPITSLKPSESGYDASLGMGVYAARQTVENWGGGLSIVSELGVGTTVRIHFKTSMVNQ